RCEQDKSYGGKRSRSIRSLPNPEIAEDRHASEAMGTDGLAIDQSYCRGSTRDYVIVKREFVRVRGLLLPPSAVIEEVQ
ncbi:MAG: hypothetical protein WCG81_04210, partial [Candidatus Angelobacter sp.]